MHLAVLAVSSEPFSRSCTSRLSNRPIVKRDPRPNAEIEGYPQG